MSDHSPQASAVAWVSEIMDSKEELSVRYDKLRETATKLLRKGGEGDPLGENAELGESFWREAVRRLISPHKWHLPAERLLVDLHSLLAERQLKEQRHVPRAMLSQYLTEIQCSRGANQPAFRWALHTQAEDILNNHKLEGGYGKQWLRGAFGVTEDELNTLTELAKACRGEITDNWSVTAGYPEEVVRRMSLDQNQGRWLCARAICEETFPLCPAYLGSLWNSREVASPNTTAKGDSLEALASYLCGLLPGCVPQRKVKDTAGAAEYDLLVSNLSPRESLTTSVFGREFIVECKNWETKAGVPEVGYFLFRMISTRTRFGIMWSKNGVSGKTEEERAARALIRREFQQHGNVCVVLDKHDIEQLVAGQATDFLAMLLTKVNTFRFGTPAEPT